MRIAEFRINKYGPLRIPEKIVPGKFTLFFGRNENGKTLTIDALIKFLLGKRVKDFRQAERVSEDPAGYLKMIFDENDIEKKLPDDGDLTSITKSMNIPLTPSDCRNIFIIRNSDLSLSDEARFYTGITDKLIGLRTGDIGKIRRNLMEIGSLTPTMGFRDDEKSGRLKGRIANAKKLIDRMEKVRERLIGGNYYKLEVELYRKTRELGNINDTLNLFEDARSRSLYERSSKLLKDLEECIALLKNMEVFVEDDAVQWQNLERDLKRSHHEISQIKEKENYILNEISFFKKELENLKSRLAILGRKKSVIDDERLRLKNLESTEYEIDSDASLRKLLKRVSILSFIITLPVIGYWFFYSSLYLYVAGIISILITSGLWIYEIILFFKRRRFSRELGRIIINLSENGIRGSTVEEVLTYIGKFNEDYEKAQIDSNKYENDLTSSERHLKEIREETAEYWEAIDQYERKILSFKTKSGQSSLDDYRENLNRKKKKENERDNIANRLAGMLETQGRSMGELINNIKAKISEIETYKEKAKEIEFNIKTYNDLKEKNWRIEQDLNNIRQKIDAISDEMSKLEAWAGEVLIGDEKVFCKTLVDLNEILTRLKAFVEENDNRRIAVSAAVDILNEIELEEKGRVIELFGNEGPCSVSALFRDISAGLYDEVIYEPEDESINVRHKNGKVLSAEKLSGGAYDQLYLAVRLALGDKLLNHEKGFFIMDDPFIKSDMERIEKQAEVLKKISEIGWQILYFSCKNEIKDIFLYDIEKGTIGYYEINMNT